MRQAIIDSLGIWLAGVAATQVQPVLPQSGFAPENAELHSKLETILNSGDEGTIRAVVPNIEIFYERLKPVPRKRRTG